jgi:trimethylamine--corrinoid protein Co-methyltransferase
MSDDPAIGSTGRAGTRRSSRKGRRATSQQLPWRLITNPYRPIEVFSAEQIEAIHDASLIILEEIGIRILLPEARAMLRGAGAKVDPDTRQVYFDRGLVMEKVALAPRGFTLHARNPARNVPIGGNAIAIATTAGTPNVTDIDRGRRPGNFEDYVSLLKLAQSLDIVHLNGGYVPEPIDVDVKVRHLLATEAMLTFTDKVPWAFTFTPRRMQDVFEMLRIVRGVSADQLLGEPSFYSVVNTNSPLQIDEPMCWGIIEMARLGQALIVTPFTLAGAMAPVTLAGALAQQNAEALAGIALSQICRPGAPIVYGGFTSNVDMRTGSPAFGTPEYAKAAIAGGQLARRYGLPYRSSNVNASNAADGQATWESMMSIWATMMGGVNLLLHGTGWLEGGLTASFEKYIMDAEMLQGMAEFLRPEAVDEGSLALAAIREVGPGGHFFGSSHTLARYETAFYTPLLSDWRTFQQWSADGGLDATRRANRIWKSLLEEYQPPPLDPAVVEELGAFVKRRIEEGGAPIDG